MLYIRKAKSFVCKQFDIRWSLVQCSHDYTELLLYCHDLSADITVNFISG